MGTIIGRFGRVVDWTIHGFDIASWSQIIRATTGIFRDRTVSAQLIESVPANTMANLTTAGNGGS
jgi:hypothetical protein